MCVYVCVHVCIYIIRVMYGLGCVCVLCMDACLYAHSHCACMSICMYWRMQNNCTTSDSLKRFVFQRCRLLLVVNVKKKYTQCKYATLYGHETVAR
jgi:hypothetical protein